MVRNFAAALFLVMLFRAPALRAQSPTTLDGVYSDPQAARGKTLYTTHCGTCHGASLEGVSAPQLTGTRFLERWREGVLDSFYTFIRDRMPFGRPANSQRIPDKDYLDILTYILQVNGYRAGANELTPEMLGNVIFVGLNGPKPVPDGSLVMTVGCLAQGPPQGPNDAWVLLQATEPAKTRTSTTSTPAELKASSQKPLGTLTFRLTDMEAIPDFAPEAHKGHKMQAKGYIVRQPNAERISLSAMDMLDTSCGQ